MQPVSFLVFFVMWARVQKWTVPRLHVQICLWLDTCEADVRLLMVFRGAAKSTIYAIWKAYQLYKNRSNRSLIYAADDKLATKLTRDTLNVLRRHPLCAGMLPPKPGAKSFWVNGSTDARNPSMEAVGINSNATGSRADDADFDDVEVPKNIKTPEARLNLRVKAEESTHILVPGGRKTFIGTPHTHDTIYAEQEAGGAATLRIPLFAQSTRYTDTAVRTRYRIGFVIEADGLYAFVGIHKFARLLAQGTDYVIDGEEIVFAGPPAAVLDLYTGCAWPERFDRPELLKRRKETRTLNGWDSQYQLEAKPVEEIRLDPERITPYDCEPEIRFANDAVSMWLGAVRLEACALRWDPASGKLGSDVSAASLVFQDGIGRRYIHRVAALTGELATFDDAGKKIIGGQVWQLCDLVAKYEVPRIVLESNGIGGFSPTVLKAALKQRRLQCGVTAKHSSENKNRRILEGLEPLLLSPGMLWAHVSVLDGPLWDQMKDWNPAVSEQPDDFLDSTAAACTEIPERIHRIVGNPTPGERQDWRADSGVHDVIVEY